MQWLTYSRRSLIDVSRHVEVGSEGAEIDIREEISERLKVKFGFPKKAPTPLDRPGKNNRCDCGAGCSKERRSSRSFVEELLSSQYLSVGM